MVQKIVIIAWALMVKSNNKSFTLVELLIVATIIVLLSGTSLAILTSYKDDKQLNAQVSLFMHTLEQAKSTASSGDVSLCGTNGANPTPYIDSFTVALIGGSPQNLSLIPGCTITEPTPKNFPVPTNITYIVPTFALRFDGQNYQGATRLFPIENTTTHRCKYVQIDETGLISNGNCTDNCNSCP